MQVACLQLTMTAKRRAERDSAAEKRRARCGAEARIPLGVGAARRSPRPPLWSGLTSGLLLLLLCINLDEVYNRFSCKRDPAQPFGRALRLFRRVHISRSCRGTLVPRFIPGARYA